jgi:integrase
VTAQAGGSARSLDEEGELLRAAAWLHDVGYTPSLAVTGFHPLDGARYLTTADVPDRLIGLVAFHSSAAAEAIRVRAGVPTLRFHDLRHTAVSLLLALGVLRMWSARSPATATSRSR